MNILMNITEKLVMHKPNNIELMRRTYDLINTWGNYPECDLNIRGDSQGFDPQIFIAYKFDNASWLINYKEEISDAYDK